LYRYRDFVGGTLRCSDAPNQQELMPRQVMVYLILIGVVRVEWIFGEMIK